MNSQFKDLKKNKIEEAFCQLFLPPSPLIRRWSFRFLEGNQRHHCWSFKDTLWKELFMEVWVGLKDSTKNGEARTQGVMRVRDHYYFWAGSDKGGIDVSTAWEELEPWDWRAWQELWLNSSSSKLHVYKNHLGVLLKGRFWFCHSVMSPRFCSFNKSRMILKLHVLSMGHAIRSTKIL